MDLPSTSSQGGDDEIVRSTGGLKKNKLIRDITVFSSLGYDRSEKSLEKSTEINDGDDSSNSVDDTSLLILEHKFYELLSRGKFVEASKTLRHEIAPLGISEEIVRKLSTLVVSPPQNLCGQELGIRSRKRLLEDLRNLLPPKKSLKPNHQHGKDEPRFKPIKKLKCPDDEVWFMQFSHNGKYLAAAGGTVVGIWKFLDSGECLLHCKLVGHTQPVSYITWKRNYLQLLSCGVEESVKRWNIAPFVEIEYVLLRTYGKQNLGTVSCVWAPDGKHIFTGFNDGSINMWNLQGEEVLSWQGGYTTRIADLAISPDGEELISTYRYNRILLFKWRTEARRYIDEFEHIISFTLSKDGRFLLVSMSYEQIDLWNIKDQVPYMVMTYEWHIRKSYVLRACFVGRDEDFIASGSEDSKVYLWHTETGELMCTFDDHSAVVNCVCSNPARPDVIASGSDDRSIIVQLIVRR
ncbi:hypothetical protein ABFX02_04G157200 [Erythranthe guttata]